jgi:hypothetical protein
VQYHPPEYLDVRLHPLHCSKVWWQVPPLKEQPCFVINKHSTPGFAVVQSIRFTPFFADIVVVGTGGKNLEDEVQISLELQPVA